MRSNRIDRQVSHVPVSFHRRHEDVLHGMYEVMSAPMIIDLFPELLQ